MKAWIDLINKYKLYQVKLFCWFCLRKVLPRERDVCCQLVGTLMDCVWAKRDLIISLDEPKPINSFQCSRSWVPKQKAFWTATRRWLFQHFNNQADVALLSEIALQTTPTAPLCYDVRCGFFWFVCFSLPQGSYSNGACPNELEFPLELCLQFHFGLCGLQSALV